MNLVFIDLERQVLEDYFKGDLEPMNHGGSVKELTRNVNRAIADLREECEDEDELLDAFRGQFFAVENDGDCAGVISVEIGPNGRVAALASPTRRRSAATRSSA